MATAATLRPPLNCNCSCNCSPYYTRNHSLNISHQTSGRRKDDSIIVASTRRHLCCPTKAVELVRHRRKEMLLFASTVLAFVAYVAHLPAAAAVDCFKCSSRNGSNPACEDPFHNLNTSRITSPHMPDPQPDVVYHTPCFAGRKGRQGLFPASACIKLMGTFDKTGEKLVVRHCALDSGTLTQDTEIARMSHCGRFHFEGDYLKGCVLACPEDGCNGAPTSLAGARICWWLIAASVVVATTLTAATILLPSCLSAEC